MRAFLLARGVDGDDVGVVQPGRRLRLAAEALHRLAGQPQPARQDLQRHLAVERYLTRRVDHPHAAAAQLADDLEVAEPRAGQVRHRSPLRLGCGCGGGRPGEGRAQDNAGRRTERLHTSRGAPFPVTSTARVASGRSTLDIADRCGGPYLASDCGIALSIITTPFE